MKTAVVVDGPIDKLLVDRLVADELRRGHLSVQQASGPYAAAAAAATLNALYERPVVLLVDAETTDPAKVAEYEQHLDYRLSRPGGPQPAQYVLARPELEAVFFDPAASGIVERIVGLDLTLEHRIRAEYEPKRVLLTLLGDRDPIWFIDQLTDDDVARLRETAIARQLLAAIAEVSGIPA